MSLGNICDVTGQNQVIITICQKSSICNFLYNFDILVPHYSEGDYSLKMEPT